MELVRLLVFKISFTVWRSERRTSCERPLQKSKRRIPPGSTVPDPCWYALGDEQGAVGCWDSRVRRFKPTVLMFPATLAAFKTFSWEPLRCVPGVKFHRRVSCPETAVA